MGIALGFLAVVSAAQAQPPVEASAELNPGVIGVTELAELRISVRGSGLEGMEPPTFRLANLEVADGPRTAVGTRDASGRRQVTFRWLLSPQAVGAARVFGLRVEVDGRRIELPSRNLRVQPRPTGNGMRPPGDGRRPLPGPESPHTPLGDAPPGSPATATAPPKEEPATAVPTPPQRPAGKPRVLLRAQASPRRPYVGQQVVYTLYIYYQADVHSIRPRELPQFHGFWVREISVPPGAPGEPVQYGGRSYQRSVLLRRALFPLRAGELEIRGAEAQMIADQGTADAPRGELLQRRSNDLTLEVRPLPDPAPEGFSGAVGDFRLSTRLEPAEVAVGEAAMWNLTLQGTGSLASVAPPRPKLPEGLEASLAEQDLQQEVQGRTVHGERTWRFLLVPREQGELTVPEVSIPFFDPRQETYRTATAPATPLRVVRSGELATGTTSTTGSKSAEEPLSEESSGSRSRSWTLTILAVLMLMAAAGAGGFFLARRGRSRDTGGEPHPGRSSEKHSSRTSRVEAPSLRQRLAELKSATAQASDAAAAQAMERYLRSLLALRWPEIEELKASRWAPWLRRHNHGRHGLADTADDVQRLVEDLDFLRRAPQLSDNAALRADLLRRCRTLGRQLSR